PDSNARGARSAMQDRQVALRSWLQAEEHRQYFARYRALSQAKRELLARAGGSYRHAVVQIPGRFCRARGVWRQLAPHEGNRSRRGHPRGIDSYRANDEGVSRYAIYPRGSRARRNESIRARARRFASGSSRRRAKKLGRRDALLHRIQGTQYPNARAGDQARFQAERIWFI